MKKRLHNIITCSATIIILSFTSCQKEVSNSQPQQTLSATSSDNFSYYNACNLLITLFNPPATTTYNLAMPSGDLYLRFGIPGVAELDFQHIDNVTFEFSGQYNDKLKTAKLYRIRRSDGKYLTNAFGAANYGDKLEDAIGAQYQLFILNNLGGNKFNLILPKMSTCNIMATYFYTVSQKYRAAFVYIDQQTTVNKEITLIPVQVNNNPNTH